jgi:hypothetical protein
MERVFKNIGLERAASIAFDSLKESSQHDIENSLNKVLDESSETNYAPMQIEGDVRKYFIMNVGKYKVIFEREPDLVHVHAILSGNFGKSKTIN